MPIIKKILATLVLLAVMGGAAAINNKISESQQSSGQINSVAVFINFGTIAVYVIVIYCIVKVWKKKA